LNFGLLLLNKMHFGGKIVKYLLLLFSLAYLLFGLLLVVISAITLAKLQPYSELEGTYGFTTAPVLMLILGCIIFLLAAFGCCAVWQENSCLLKSFAFVLITILLATIAITITVLVLKNQARTMAETFFKTAINSYDKSEYKELMDKIQSNYSCCGSNNYTDWKDKFQQNRVPESCCVNRTVCSVVYSPNAPPPRDYYQQGCASALGHWLSVNMGNIAIISTSVCVIQMLGIMLSCLLIQAVEHAYAPV
jgi:CD63 antigen